MHINGKRPLFLSFVEMFQDGDGVLGGHLWFLKGDIENTVILDVMDKVFLP